MTILVFGRTGQVARELQVQTKVLALGRDQADLSDPVACEKAIRETRPRAVINAAAYTAVDRAEGEEDLATIVNGDSPGAMARACADLGIPFLHVSTDYVFDGSGTAPWRESDPVSPQNAYGRSKLAGERAVRAAGGHYAILRTSWVFSAHGANFVKTMLRLADTREALTIVDDQTGGPTPADDIAATLLSMSGQMLAGKPGGTYHFAGAPAVSWAGLAREIFGQSGRAVTVTGIPSAEYPTPAVRPLNSRLDCAKIRTDFGITQPNWKTGLTRVLQQLESGA